MAECLRIDRTAEHSNHRIAEYQIDSAEDQAADDRHQDGIADASLCLIGFPSAEAQADESAAAVTDHHSDCQRYDRQRKYDRICGISVRAEIACIGDEDLVNNVVERADEQRDDTGNSIFPHKPAHRFAPQKLI